MSELKLTTPCGTCGGTQEISNPDQEIGGTVTCNSCENGTILLGIIDTTAITDMLNDIMDKCNDIFEKVNE